MTKVEKAQRTIWYLSGESWITYDATLRGAIGYHIKDIDRIIEITSDRSPLQSSKIIVVVN